MSEEVSVHWPTAELGPLRRMRIIAGSMKNSTYAERHFDVPLPELWAVASDLEAELPHLLPRLRSFTYEPSEGKRLRAVAVSTMGHREHFEIALQPGWCLMQSKLLVGAMAAEPEGSGTRFAFMSSYRFPGGSSLQLLRRLGMGTRRADMFRRLDLRIKQRSAPSPAE